MTIGDVRPKEINEDHPSSNEATPPIQANDQDKKDEQDKDKDQHQDAGNDQGGVVQDEKEEDQEESRSSSPPHPRVRQTIQRNHPIDNILGDIKKGVTTRSHVINFCEHYSFVSSLKYFKVEYALRDSDWVAAMKEDLNNFKKNQPLWSCGYALQIMMMIEKISDITFINDMVILDIKSQSPTAPTITKVVPPPSATPSTHSGKAPSSSTTAAPRAPSTSGSTKGRSGMLKLFKGLISMCQRTNRRLDVIKQKLDANSYNHKLIHSKLQIKEPLKEVSDAEDDLPEPIDPFAYLTPDELVYFEMGDSHLGGCRWR
jgi:hypothetical protein